MMSPLMLFISVSVCLPHLILTRSSNYEADYGVTYQGNISADNVINYHYNNTAEASPAIRISVSSSASPQCPVSFVVLQQKSVLSWSVPFQLASKTVNYSNLSHTLCPKPNENGGLSVRVSTFSLTNLSFSLLAQKNTSFLLKTGDPVKTSAAPTEPLLLQYVFPEGSDTVMVSASSDDDICAYLSVQDKQCPVYDLFDNVQFKGTYQTMTRKSAITVQRRDHPDGFYVIVVIHPDDDLCNSRFEPLSHGTGTSSYYSGDDKRHKTLEITVEETTSEYKEPVLITICIGIAFYAFIGLTVFGYWLKNWCRGRQDNISDDQEHEVSRMLIDNPSNETTNRQGLGYGSFDSGAGLPSNEDEHRSTILRSVSLSSGVPPLQDEDAQSDDAFDGFDTLEDIEHEQTVYLSKKQLFLSDTTRQEGHVREKKFKKYPWNLVTVAVFYALPVVQLVITYQIVVNLTGNQDTCYYNFLCSRPASVFSAFNNVFSNIGYIMLGILFWLLVWRREIIYKKSIEAENNEVGSNQATGIPKHYSLFYSLALALIVEGIMSGCYHVCPNNTNFQFDTSFMYIIACLCMLKLYQQRHPDINPESYRAFFVFAVTIFLGMLGVIFHNIYTYVIFFLLHISICVYMSLHIYYKSTMKFDTGTFARAKLEFRSMIANKDFKPMHLGRFAILLFGNLCNLALSLFGLITRPLDFASFLLSIFIMNLLLYLGFYILMKLFHRERLTPLVLFFIMMTMLLWAPALYFFEQSVTAWQETPALSRVHNRPCIVLDFYDSHDIWHFLSAGGLFFSFMTIFVLDDDLEDKPRGTIPVF